MALEKGLIRIGAKPIRLGSEVIGYTQTESNITVKLADDAAISGDILIGADGIHSAIRAVMIGKDNPQFTGHTAWRAVVPVNALGDLAPRPGATVWTGPGRHCVTYLLRGGELANLVAVVERDDWTRENWTEEGNRDDALRDFQGWHPIITNMIEKAGKLHRWALYDRKPLPSWIDGRAVLLGDAAHPMLPFMAQGAAMAVEDSWVLSKKISIPDIKTEDALRNYQNIRHARTSKMQAVSRANGKTFHRRTKLAQIATFGPMWLGVRFFPEAAYRRLDWIYKHDVTKKELPNA